MQNHTEWFKELRAQMRAAFAPVNPALVTMYWFNRDIKRALCKHHWHATEDGSMCFKCGSIGQLGED